ncbi:hypothetical protein [Blastococcus xanthinilyticus]|uniref:DUF3040 family protein n=1 Tax=Blastococcus xanthinilyticus TaxID=1564164 RepID=A0A5S5D371_9ACTN|nr:hypothetical protein [Blastococcus xanthinilyticus]TYP89069.1 hypothetical protein BD833_103226 [Blastococcus xanthinilyticus]
MTADEHGRASTDAEVRAAAERWARAAGVPPSVAFDATPRTSTTARFSRGVLLGLAAGALLATLAVLVQGAATTAGAWPLLVPGVGLLLLHLARQRRRTAGPAS